MEQMERRTGELDAVAAEEEEATFGDGQGGAPLVTQNVQADAAVGVDVGVVYAGGEVNLGRLERVVGGEVDGEEEDAARVGRVGLQGQRGVEAGGRNIPGP
jgi:hypothetical protein